MQEIMEFIYWLVEAEELAIAKALRQILVDKQKQLRLQQVILMYSFTKYVSYVMGKPSMETSDFKCSPPLMNDRGIVVLLAGCLS